MIYVLSLLFTTFFVFYTKYQLYDLWRKRNVKWKHFGAAMRVLFFASCYVTQSLSTLGWHHYLLAGVLNIIWFDIGINIIALKEKWNYVGLTSKADRKLRQRKWLYYCIFLVVSLSIVIFVELY